MESNLPPENDERWPMDVVDVVARSFLFAGSVVDGEAQ